MPAGGAGRGLPARTDVPTCDAALLDVAGAGGVLLVAARLGTATFRSR